VVVLLLLLLQSCTDVKSPTLRSLPYLPHQVSSPRTCPRPAGTKGRCV